MALVGFTAALPAQEGDYETKFQSSMQQAMALYHPMLVIAPSPLKIAFDSEIHRLLKEDPSFFENPDFPLILMSKTAERLGISPVTQFVSDSDLRSAERDLAFAQHEADWALSPYFNIAPERRKRAYENLIAAKKRLVQLQEQSSIQHAPERARQEEAEAKFQQQAQAMFQQRANADAEAEEEQEQRARQDQREKDELTYRARHEVEKLENERLPLPPSARASYTNSLGNDVRRTQDSNLSRRFQEVMRKDDDANNEQIRNSRTLTLEGWQP